jgi:hypothetical protein
MRLVEGKFIVTEVPGDSDFIAAGRIGWVGRRGECGHDFWYLS